MAESAPSFWDSFRYELSMPARRLTPADVLDIAGSAERNGWSGVWVSEVLSLDGAVLLGALARTCPTLRLGTSIVPISTRSAALLGMMAATVEGLAPGRFVLGVGVSTPAIVKDRHDRAVPRPLETTTGVLSVVRRALRGEVVEHAAEPRVSNLRLDAPASPPPVLLAGLGPKMVQIAYDHADGLILNLVPLAVATQHAQEGRQLRGSAYPTLLSQRVCVEPSAADMDAIRREIASYSRVGVYAASLARCGWDLDPVRAASANEAPALLPDEMLHELVITGTARECTDRLQRIAAAGVRPIVVPVGAGDTARNLLAKMSTVS